MNRIKTRRSLTERVLLTVWYSAQRSWYPAICFYALLAALVIGANLEKFA